MAKPSPPFTDEDTDVSLWGRRAAERYDDDALAGLGGLANLETCFLYRQRITRLPDGLERTRLTHLVLAEMPSLASIDGIEKVVTLRRVSLDGLANLELERAFERLAELPELVELAVGGETFVKMPAAVTKLPSLIEVKISDCPKLDFAGAFALLGELAFLRNLSVVQRSRMSLPDVFAPLRQVRELELLFYMKYLPPSIGAMAKLERLELERNYFTAIPATFGKLAALRELDVPHSRITKLPDELCDCAALEKLVLRGNPLKALPARIGELAKLTTLDVSFTKIRTLPASFGQLAALRSLGLPDDVTEVPESFFSLALTELSGASTLAARVTLGAVPTPDEDVLYLHDVDRIPDALGQPIELKLYLRELARPLPQLAKLRRLRELDLEIGELDHALPYLAGVETLTRLRIEGTHATLPASIGRLASLETLVVTAPLASLPRELGQLARLRSLRLASAKLAALPEEIGELAALAALVVSSEELARLPGSIGRLAALSRLELDAGAFVDLPPELARCGALESLSIAHADGAKLRGLDVIGALPALERLTFSQVAHLDLPTLCRVLADRHLAYLSLSGCELGALPDELARVAVTELDLTRTKIATLAPLRECLGLRTIRLSPYELAPDVRKRVKEFLPRGRWRKQDRRHTLVYERSD